MSKQVAVLMGGRSEVRGVSLRSGEAVAEALRSLGYHVLAIDIGQDIRVMMDEIPSYTDVVFNALHGLYW